MLFSTFRVNVQEVEHLECGMQPLSPDPDEPGANPAEKAPLSRLTCVCL